MHRDERLQPEMLSGSASRLQMALQAARMVAWEFEVATGTVQYSGNVNSIFGHDPHATAHTIPAFDDRTLAADLLEHAQGAGPYSSEFRVVKPDGSVVWIRNQGETVHDNEGQPSRIIGVTLDITERKEAEELLHNIAAGVSVTTGEAFFRLLTKHLCEALKTDFACIGELDIKHPEKVRTVAVFSENKYWDELEYELANTPCEQALTWGHCSYPRGVQSAFPLDHLLAEIGIESYLGVALIGSADQPLGVMSVMNRAPLKNVKSAKTILNIFASRAAAELERRRWERALRESEVTNRAIVRALPDLIVVSNNRGLILELYGKDPTEFGFTLKSLPGKLDDVLGPEAAQGVLVSTTSDSNEPTVVEYSIPGPGPHRFYEARTISFGDDRLLTIVRNISSKEQAERGLQELSGRLLSVADDERRRIARELHDVTGQNLTAISFNLTAMELADVLPLNVKKVLADCQTLCEESQKEIRTLSYLLHPPTLDKFGLVGALEWFVEGFIERTGIHVALDVKKELGRLPAEMEMNLFRVVQEGLMNIRSNTGSDTAIIRLDKQETQLVLQIEDRRNGVREQAGPTKHGGDIGAGVGIPGMRERLRQHGGSLEICSDPTGTTLTAVVPLTGHATQSTQRSQRAGQP